MPSGSRPGLRHHGRDEMMLQDAIHPFVMDCENLLSVSLSTLRSCVLVPS